MPPRPLLDYLSDFDPQDEPAEPATYSADDLRKRLQELESRLSAATRHPEPEQEETGFSSQIEAILKRRNGLAAEAVERPVAPRTPPVARIPMQAPPLAHQLPEISGDFAKFIEAVHLVGQAAERFLGQPGSIPALEQQPVPVRSVQNGADFAATMVQMVTAFRQMTTELSSLTQELRHKQPHEEPRMPELASRRISREDAELYRLQDDLDELRERLASVTRRRSRNPY
ncbi:hypothetical protein JJB09_01575 [Rhizobium sp. KVB221]|uniref:Uncharacterized protein n=1 Tax=Rhizobium setariae TaxID=2801340 RepID=A0A936YQH7_9HYPH|nr:hypothetical protein [Rhizobium setariae]MBL0370707.1 hypothetical protein [Rhizobium setariae]